MICKQIVDKIIFEWAKDVFFSLQLNGSKYHKGWNSSIGPIDWTLLDNTTPGKSRPGSNDIEKVLHIIQSYRSWTSLLDGLVSYTG